MESTATLTAFTTDVLNGLNHNPKYLLSKYFYDDRGSRIFQDIMQMPEYYLTNCEFEILDNQAPQILDSISNPSGKIDLIELGAGDGLKTRVLLRHFLNDSISLKYMPIDISREAIRSLLDRLNGEAHKLETEPFVGDFFDVIPKIKHQEGHRRVFLFLGSSIGNFTRKESKAFLKKLRSFMFPGDMLFIGFDLKKSPDIILPAYDDPHKHTEAFNLNLLSRINRELNADFVLDNFQHYANYNPLTGEAKSFLISRKDQVVNFREVGETVKFKKWEPVFMEVSQKYDIEMIENFAQSSGFKTKTNFFDNRGYFVDSLWEA